jgi:hypothetical protein
MPMQKMIFCLLFNVCLLWSFGARAELCDQSKLLDRAVCLHGNQKFKEAFSLMESEAKKGEKGAQLILADMYFSGEGTTPNFSKAVYWAKMAYFAKARGAAKRLAGFYSLNKNNLTKRIGWLSVSSQEGDPNSMLQLAEEFDKKNLTSDDQCLAFYWYDKAIFTSNLEVTIDKLNPETLAQINLKIKTVKRNCDVLNGNAVRHNK